MPTPTYVPLATITLGSTEADIVFSSIPATYRDLVLVTNAKASEDAGVRIQFNSDTGSKYSSVFMRGTGSSATSGSSTTTSLDCSDAFTSQGYIGIFQIMDYSATDKHKSTLLRKGAAFEDVQATAGRYADNAAINSLTIFVTSPRTLSIGSTFSLYGIVA
jgi:hypothetical protein